jgi:transposase-like protein
MTIGHSEAETFWVEFLRSLTIRGLRGVKLVISDAHEGLKAAITKVWCDIWERCRVHFMLNAMAHRGESHRPHRLGLGRHGPSPRTTLGPPASNGAMPWTSCVPRVKTGSLDG